MPTRPRAQAKCRRGAVLSPPVDVGAAIEQHFDGAKRRLEMRVIPIIVVCGRYKSQVIQKSNQDRGSCQVGASVDELDELRAPRIIFVVLLQQPRVEADLLAS